MNDDNGQMQQEQQEEQEYNKVLAEQRALFDSGKLDDEYSSYIMEHCGGDRIICNGDTLIDAIESGYLYDEFIDHRVGL